MSHLGKYEQVVVVLASIIGYCLTLGISLSFGVYYVMLSEYFASSRQTVGWLASINLAALYLASPASQYLAARYGTGKVICAGCVMSAVGHGSSALALDVWHLMLTYSVISGIGFGFTLLPCLMSVQVYFKSSTHLFLAVALVPLGTVMGTLVFPPLFTFLLTHYSWRGSMLITAAIITHQIPCALILDTRKRSSSTLDKSSSTTRDSSTTRGSSSAIRDSLSTAKDSSFTTTNSSPTTRAPVTIVNKRLQMQVNEDLRESYETLNIQVNVHEAVEDAPMHDVNICRSDDDAALVRDKIACQREDDASIQLRVKVPQPCEDESGDPAVPVTTAPYMECRLSRCYYLVFLLSWPLHCTSTAIYVQIVDHVLVQGVPLHTALTMMQSVSMGNLVGRLAYPVTVIALRRWGSALNLPNYRCVLAYLCTYGAAICLLSLTPVTIRHGVSVYHVYSFMFGLGFGGHMSSFPNMVLELYGCGGFARTIGHCIFSGTLGAMLAPPLAGLLYDVTHTYQIPLIIISICVFLAVGCIVLSRYIAIRHQHYQATK